MSKPLLICGVDDSEPARRAAHVAAQLSKQLDARLVLLTAAQVGAPPAGAGFAYAKLQEEALRGAKRLLERLKEDEELKDAGEQVEVGAPAPALLEAADSERADMLIIGTRGRGALKAAVLGSVSSDVAANAPCPVIVVPPNSAAKPS